MPAKDPRVDAYIEKSQPFAMPILEHLRKLVHKACPPVEETMKWSFPHFDYKGIMCSMASFKEHAVFGFWKAAIMSNAHGALQVKDCGAMGNFDRLTSLKDLPSHEIIVTLIKEAMRLNEEEVKLPPRKKITTIKEFEVPADLKNGLLGNARAKEHFENFSPGKKKEYIEWLHEAKSDSSRAKRLETALEWISEGKSRNWKYQRS